MIEVTSRPSFIGTPEQVATQIETSVTSGRPTASSWFPTSPRAGSTGSPTRWCRSSRSGAGSAPTTRARPCATTSGSRRPGPPDGARRAGGVELMTPTRVPLGVLDLVPVSSGSEPSTRSRNTHRPGPDGRGPRLPPLLVRRAPPQPGGGRVVAGGADRHGRRGHQAHPARIGRRPERAPHGAVGRRGVRSARRPVPGTHRPRASGARAAASFLRERPKAAGDRRTAAPAQRQQRPTGRSNGLLDPRSGRRSGTWPARRGWP